MTHAPWEIPPGDSAIPTPASISSLENAIEALYANPSAPRTYEVERLLASFRAALNGGEVRPAQFDGTWKVHSWVKKALVLCMRFGRLRASSTDSSIDLDTLPRKQFSTADNVRVMDSSCFVRDGACISKGCTLMPNVAIQMGVFLGPQTTIGAGTSIGICAQIGEGVQIGAGVQVQGHIEPLDGIPAIIGDGASIGANCVIGSNVIVGAAALIFPGTILLQQTRLYDPINKHRFSPKSDEPLVIPPNAIVISGTRSLAKGATVDSLLAVQVAVIAGYTNESELPPMLMDRLLGD